MNSAPYKRLAKKAVGGWVQKNIFSTESVTFNMKLHSFSSKCLFKPCRTSYSWIDLFANSFNNKVSNIEKRKKH